MKPTRLNALAALCAAFVLLAPLSSCASSSKDTADASELRAKKRKKKNELPKNYSLFKKHELNRDILRRGQKAMQSPALDSY